MGEKKNTPQPQEGEQQDEKTDTDTRQQHLQQRNTSGELREREDRNRKTRQNAAQINGGTNMAETNSSNGRKAGSSQP